MLHKQALTVAFAVAIAGTSGCGAVMSGSLKERATDSVREFNDGIRWGNYTQVARQVTATKRDAFLARYDRIGDELEFVDYEIVGMTIKPSGGKQKDNEILVRVHYDWTLHSRGLIERTDTEQHWKEEGHQFLLQEEVRMKGAPLTLFDEKSAHPVAASADAVPTASAQ